MANIRCIDLFIHKSITKDTLYLHGTIVDV